MLYGRGQNRAPSIGGRRLPGVVCITMIAALSGAVGASNTPGSLPDWEGRRANSILLNGDWEFSPGDGGERAETSEGASRLRWQVVALPGSVVKYSDPAAAQIRFGWVRRTFTISAAQAGGLAVLHWDQITFGAVAYINGRKVGENAPTGPYQVMLPPGTLRAGANAVVLRIAGGAGAPKSKSGHLLIPAGFHDTRQPPAVQGDVWIDFADTGTAENYDVHTCGNTTDPVEGELIAGIPNWLREAKGRPVTNSEYMNTFARPLGQWAGKEDKEADALACAQLGMEHTEAMRRAHLDAVLPYMYAGWTKTRTGQVWKGGFARPVSACWHSALSPILTSLDLFDPSYLTGQEVRTDLCLINDSWHDAAMHVDLLLTEECPEFIPEAECLGRPVARWSYDFALKADTLTRTPVTWRLPEREGNYWLTARTTGSAGRAVLSQRFVRAVRPPEVPATLRNHCFVILSGDAAADAWFPSRGLQTGHSLDGLTPGKHVVVIWNAAHLTADVKRRADVLRGFVAAGGRVVVVAARSWDWTELCDLKVGNTRGSRVFPYQGTSHPMLAGIRPEWLTRWNGLPGTVAVGSLDGPALAAAERILWVREPKTCVAAEVPIVGAKGTILFSQLDVQRYVDRSKPGYDPVAERVLINLLHLNREE